MVRLRAGGAGIGRHGCEGRQCALGRGNKARGCILRLDCGEPCLPFAKREITVSISRTTEWVNVRDVQRCISHLPQKMDDGRGGEK